MHYSKIEVKKGVNVHFLETDLFKTNLMAIFMSEKISKDNVTMNTFIPAVLRRGTKTIQTQEEISKRFEELYGAEFDCGIDKIGDNQVLKFYVEAINNEYIITDEDLLRKSIESLIEIVFNPILEGNAFKGEYVNEEKEKVKQLIESKIDSKDKYAMERCIEEMYKGKPFGLYKYGNVADISNIDNINLYNRYLELINNSKIDIFVSGKFNNNDLINAIKDNEFINGLQERDANYLINNETTEVKENVQESVKTEAMEIAQGKLVIGLDLFANEKDMRYAISIYNAILGGSPNSKLFQNVREKESLAYSIGSVYLRAKNNIFIKAGIEIDNYDKAIDLIKKQIEDMKTGDFTEDDLEKAKKFISYGVKAILEDQTTGITYYFGQELSDSSATVEEYIEKINSITVEDIKKVANLVDINTIYFLKN